MSDDIVPKLAAPGAGLPKVELWVGRLLFAMQRARGNRTTFTAQFKEQRARIASLVQRCDEERGARRVLIPRLRGLEDSSRYWSVWMTLDHLRIVNGVFTDVIEELGQGRVPPGVASTAAVKPSESATSAVLSRYEESCEAFLVVGARVANLHTAVRYTHPWFGPLDAAGWYALGGLHLSIHRAQLERILAK